MTAVQKTAGVTNAQTSSLTPVKTSTGTNSVKPTESQPSTPEIPQSVATLEQKITIHDVMKLLDIGNQKRELHQDFSKRLLSVENFRQKYEGGSLKMVIMSSDDNDDEITVSNHEIILEALDKTLIKGRDYLSKIEMELLSIF